MPDLGQFAQQLVLVIGQPLADLLDGVDDPADPHEADDVPGDAARQRDQLLLGPLRQRGRPRQHQQVGGVGAGGELHAHAVSLAQAACDGHSTRRPAVAGVDSVAGPPDVITIEVGDAAGADRGHRLA